MQSLLKEIADIRMGLTVRGKGSSKVTSEEGLHLLRISDLSEEGKVEIESPHRIQPGAAALERHQVLPGDVILANRGTRMTAALVPEGLEAIVSNQLFLIRLRNNRVLPRYVHWFLNLDRTQAVLRANARGSYVPTLSISVVGELEMPLPTLDQQKRIVAVAQLASREQFLLARIAELRRQFTDATLFQNTNP